MTLVYCVHDHKQEWVLSGHEPAIFTKLNLETRLGTFFYLLILSKSRLHQDVIKMYLLHRAL